MRPLRYAGAVALMVLGSAPLTPQGTGNQSADPVFRVTTDLVQLDAVVTDSKGRHVPDLKPVDFEILEDGKAQKITNFSYVQGTMQSAPAQPVRKQRGGSPVEADLAPAQPLRPEQVRRTIVLIADDLGLSADDIPNVRNAMKTFVERQMQPGDLVSVMTTSGGMGVMQQLTNDKRQLLAMIDRIHYSLGRVGATWYTPANIGDAARNVQAASSARLNGIRSPGQISGSLSSVAYAIQGLSEMPGRKAIAFFSDGFAIQPSRVIELANRASVTLYTFDARGLVVYALSAVDVCSSCAGGGSPAKIRAAEGGREAGFRAKQVGLNQMARGTGGVFFHDDNGLDRGLAEALDDMSSYYLLAYQPRRADFDGRPKFHNIKVKVLRRGLEVRSRNGFSGTPDPPPMPDRVRLSDVVHQSPDKIELRKALFSPFQAGGFPVHLSAFYSASNAQDPKSRRRPSLLRAQLAIDAHGLKFSDTPEGRKQLDLEIVAAAYGPNNGVVSSSGKTFKDAMTPDEMNQLVASGLVYNMEVEIPDPGPYQLRIAVWDANSQRAGSATTFVEVPDFNRPGIALSSVQLYDSDTARNAELAREGVLGAGSSVTRSFAVGAVLHYDCIVYGPLIDKQTGKPEFDVAVNLFRGSEQILTGPPVQLATAHAAGEIKLPATLPPGDYALELIVHDRLEKKESQGVAQWVDFTLVNSFQ